MLNVQLPAREYLSLSGVPITDAVLGSLFVSALLVIGGYIAAKKFNKVPTRMQVLYEWLYVFVEGQAASAFGTKEDGRRFAPLFLTLMIFIGAANQMALLPIIFEITAGEGPLLRQPTSDLSMTLALSLVMIVSANLLALFISPRAHIGSYLPLSPLFKARTMGQLFKAGIELFIGLLNIFGELAKVVSLSCRLFGNIFAGNVMVAVIMSLAVFTQAIVPIPFLILGTFSGFVQAYVFMTLSLQFMAGSITSARQGYQV